MDILTAVKNFEQLTGMPDAALDEEIREYGVTAREIREGKVQPSRFLTGGLVDVLSGQFKIEIDPLDEEAGWDFLYRMMEESQAFRSYCQAAHENLLIQINELDNETLELMLSLMQLKPSSMAIDIGCGNGYLTEFISDRTQAHILGVDLSPYAIQLATERTKDKRGRLTFRVGDINGDLHQVFTDHPGVDTIIAMEVLYAANDLHKTIGEMKAALPPQGQMLFIANQHIEQPSIEARRLLPDQTDIALAIQGQGLLPRVYDITPNKRRFLERSISLLEQCKATFEKEGNRDFWAGRIIYDRKMLKRVQDGLTRRFLYHVVM
jgi:cyclopropane fatty-acyl-phospholipid synthase-like methyltransferase